ncbi:hypothetical protein NDK43_25895 [Neobacillus pocheonensis]|uniref:DUF4143 domain-containing protein n=1 Tax=Neobacillus pocheonensis TaxID=363869 RepID=A0ABT0WJA7_9BACI|nr:hypothetical protein [Neobacillus pocheonensis]
MIVKRAFLRITQSSSSIKIHEVQNYYRSENEYVFTARDEDEDDYLLAEGITFLTKTNLETSLMLRGHFGFPMPTIKKKPKFDMVYELKRRRVLVSLELKYRKTDLEY